LNNQIVQQSTYMIEVAVRDNLKGKLQFYLVSNEQKQIYFPFYGKHYSKLYDSKLPSF